MADAQYANCEHPLVPGDLNLLFTDGIYEIFDTEGNEFGPENVAAFLGQSRAAPLETLLDGLLAAARNHSATRTFDDDVCMIAVEAVPV